MQRQQPPFGGADGLPLEAADELVEGDELMIADVEDAVRGAAGRRVGLSGIEVLVAGGQPIANPDDCGDDVVDVGEVALHLAVVEDIDRPAFEDRAGEQEGGHVGPAPGSVNGEETKAGGRQPIEMA